MDLKVATYFVYLLATISLTIWVARTLFTNGRVFLMEIFDGNITFADSVNKLLVVGFYLINIGYAVSTLRIAREIYSYQTMIEQLGTKIGTIILVLGFMHFLNLFIFFSLRKKMKTPVPTPRVSKAE
jgi:hypothetical protein